ncbi:hypothetical protein [Candidatus Halobonum tyrrellensis]|uniref:hypothetical protein n=1 Tax=Candidatus Halobonum tyrrellensis TaxID=1431545 RepID=UPI0009B5ABC2|nr:hypothetical protein [Candidatus Halobonum tyrrellensis]
MGNARTPVSPGQRAVLEHLEAYADDHDVDGLPRETAVEHLATHDIEAADARDRIEALLLKGYLYEVDGELRIPPRPYE